MTCKGAPTPHGARTLASIVLIFSHPLLSHPEATVRTCVAGQSRNLWNVGGHGLGIFGLERLFSDLFYSVGVGRDEICARRENALQFLLGVLMGSGETKNCARRRPSRDAWSAGGRAPRPLEGTALT